MKKGYQPRWCNGYDVRLESGRPVFNTRSGHTKGLKVAVVIPLHGAKCCGRMNWRKYNLQISTDHLHRKRRKMTEILVWAMYHFPQNSCKRHLFHRKSYM